MNRRLIRPNLAEIRDSREREKERHESDNARCTRPMILTPRTTITSSRLNKKTKMAVALADGQVIEGYIEWYDRNCFKLNRDDAPNLLVYKANIKYL